MRVHTERRTPTPTKIAFAGEKIYKINKHKRADRNGEHVLEHTRPTPSPSASVKAQRTFTVGSSHFVSISSPL
jgi:hypothetical protein